MIEDGNLTTLMPTGRKQTVLAMLALEANHVVTVDQLVDGVWGEYPPSTARSQIYICVSELRRMLGRVTDDSIIETRPPGYRVRLEPTQLDLYRFQENEARAWSSFRSGEPESAVHTMRGALELWTGRALPGTNSDLVQAKASRLNEVYLDAFETCMEWELQLGSSRELIADLTSAVSENPLRERFCGQLMTALHRSGRQAEALAAYRRTRAVLVEQLGIEPGYELRRLEQAILSDHMDPGRARREPGPAHAVSARSHDSRNSLIPLL